MRPVLTADEYGRVDAAAPGDPSEAMHRAGLAVALAAVRAGAGYGTRVVVLAGPGNNGGDGYVAARLLVDRGAHVDVHALSPPATPQASAAESGARHAGVRIRPLGPPIESDVVVDALFGGGVNRPLPDEVLEWMPTPAPVVAVDYPTGLDPNTGAVPQSAFKAVETVTFSCLKSGHVLGRGPEMCGRVTVADIGVEGGMPSMYVAEEVDAPRPSRDRRAHKWSAGSVLVVGGSVGMVGAAVMAGRSALRFGAGVVYLSTPEPHAVQALAPDLPWVSLEDAGNRLEKFDVLVMGPGLAEHDLGGTVGLLSHADRVVLDAGALQPSVLDLAIRGPAQLVLTPHNAEFQRMAGRAAGQFSVGSFARVSGAVVLRKGSPTTINDGGMPVLVDTGGPELASAGTGDVLAGMIAALWARGLDAKTAAVSAAYWHGIAGSDLARLTALTADGLVNHVGKFAW